MTASHNLNIFTKTRYSLSEEDRVVNGLLLLLDYCPASLARAFLAFCGTPNELREPLCIREHVPYAPDSIIDGELSLPGTLLIAIEAKIYQGQFEDGGQPERYLRLLCERLEPIKVLLLMSPDEAEPTIVSENSNQSSSCYMTWRSWGSVYRFLKREQENPDHQSEPTRFLVAQYLDYLDTLGLRARDSEWAASRQKVEPQLHFLLGNVAAEKILLHLYHHGGGHINGIARDHSLGTGATARVLDRFVQAGLLVRESRGRIVWYSFNNRSPLLKPLTEMLRLVYESIPENVRKTTFEPTYVPDS